MNLNWQAVMETANDDGEFRLHARHWQARLRFQMGEAITDVDVADGRITAVHNGAQGGSTDLMLKAPDEVWREMLKPIPKPFFHDPRAASRHHGLDIIGSHKHQCAYYPAVRRLFDIMRQHANDRVAS